MASSSNSNSQPRRCPCSPTSHPGSFRCSLHRNLNTSPAGRTTADHVSPSHCKIAMVAKANSIKALMLQIIKPPWHAKEEKFPAQAFQQVTGGDWSSVIEK
ncbi:hypothetical protein F3Y22_tig00111022pilonHSYRG00059 [Hibiscus syriacus]|uniref:Serine-rich protein-related n=1 Tax=Hibiscus syriacus TaxID=106335 RepID=A0A6A2Z6R8_HIBSY|nr:hypothetical protein F3Y22_tig00111022pilonHSYRG00059 [Hibiscus syriacus]